MPVLALLEKAKRCGIEIDSYKGEQEDEEEFNHGLEP